MAFMYKRVSIFLGISLNGIAQYSEWMKRLLSLGFIEFGYEIKEEVLRECQDGKLYRAE